MIRAFFLRFTKRERARKQLAEAQQAYRVCKAEGTHMICPKCGHKRYREWCPYCDTEAKAMAMCEDGEANQGCWSRIDEESRAYWRQKAAPVWPEIVSQMVRGTVYAEHYRAWPTVEVSNQRNDSPIAKHCDALADAILTNFSDLSALPMPCATCWRAR